MIRRLRGESTPSRPPPKTLRKSQEFRQFPTEAEHQLWHALRGHRLINVHFRRQHAIGNYIVDFCAPRMKLIIEVDGDPHNKQKEYDTERTRFLESKGYIVLRFWNNDIMNNLASVISTIMKVVSERDNREDC